jgi:hypothetical protein
VSEPKVQAMFETTTEVLELLIKAYEDYDQQAEAALRPVGPQVRLRGSLRLCCNRHEVSQK